MLRNIISRVPTFTLTSVAVIAILYMTLSPQPLPDMELSMFNGIDKIAHFLMMYGLTGIIAFDILTLKRHKSTRSAPTATVIAITVATIIFGGAIELVQQAMALGRGGDITDFIADIFGSLAAMVTIFLLWPHISRWYHIYP